MIVIFDGKSFAKQKEKVLQGRIQLITKKLGRKPKLVAIGIGSEKDDSKLFPSETEMYLRMKEKAAEKLGVNFEKLIFPTDSNINDICKKIAETNSDRRTDGLLLELPIPKKFSVTKIMEQVSPQKDPDGMTYENLGRLLYGKPRVFPATVRAIKEILFTVIARSPDVHRDDVVISKIDSHAPPTAGLGMTKILAFKNAVVIGGGVELGKPLALFLSDLGAGVSLCRSTTKNLSEFTQNADLIISACGVPNLVKGEMVKKDVVVIDAGINLVNGKTQGDVEFETVSQKASFITPVPGGVGPVTIVSLFENLVALTQIRHLQTH